MTTITLPSGLELSARLLKREHNGDLVGWFELWSSPVVVYRQKGRWTSKRYQRAGSRVSGSALSRADWNALKAHTEQFATQSPR